MSVLSRFDGRECRKGDWGYEKAGTEDYMQVLPSTQNITHNKSSYNPRRNRSLQQIISQTPVLFKNILANPCNTMNP